MPSPVARFVDAKQRKDTDAAIACFAADAVVHDDGHTHTGVEAVRAWMEGVSSTFDITYEVVRTEQDGSASATFVAASGDFPGSPITFRYDAEVADDRITSLAIAPAPAE